MFLCPKCGGELLFVIGASNTYRVDPVTGEFRLFDSDDDTCFTCRKCGARFEPKDDALPFEYDPDEVRAVTKEAQPV